MRWILALMLALSLFSLAMVACTTETEEPFETPGAVTETPVSPGGTTPPAAP